MDISEILSDVKRIPVLEIKPSSHNPRGLVKKDESFDRLVASINEVDVLVPLVVSEINPPVDGKRYELVDGERRFWAARALAKQNVPANVLREGRTVSDLRKLMFHLHMTREQWEPLSQCRSLVEAYPQLEDGIKFDEKTKWKEKLVKETGMQSRLAMDRVHVLAWPKELKSRFFEFSNKEPNKDIYSYILAIEASVVEPSIKAFPSYYNHGKPIEIKANEVRGSLLSKTIDGFETGSVRSREQIRVLAPLFYSELPQTEKKVAQSLFSAFVKKPDVQFDDIKAEMTAKLPVVLKEKTLKPQRLLDSIRAFAATLENFDPILLQTISNRESTKQKFKKELIISLEGLEAALITFRELIDE